MSKKLILILIAALALPVLSAMAGDRNSGDSYFYKDTTWREFEQMGLRCGTRQVYEDEARQIDRSLKAWLDANSFMLNSATIPTVNVYFHVMQKDSTVAGGNIPDSWITSQISVLNQSYGNFNFNLVSIQHVTNSNYFNATGADKNMKKTYHQGTCKDLNVYTVNFTNNLLGIATFPNNCKGNGVAQDGVVIHYESLPGGNLSPYNQGDTLTHEAGHWVGLYHTFQGGCNSPGDSVDDTPYEASPAYGCPTGRDTCSQSGLDPIKNFMDYSDDTCMNTFSSGQNSRSSALSAQYRGLN